MAEQKGRGSRRRRAAKAPILDLDATEISEDSKSGGAPAASSPDRPGTEQSPAGSGSSDRQNGAGSAPAEQKSGWGLKAAAIAAVFIAGGGAGAWLYRDLAANYVPATAFTQQTGQVSALESRIAALEKQGTSAKDALAKLTAENTALKDALKSADQSPELDKAIKAAAAAGAKAEEASKQISAASEQASNALAATETLKSGLAGASRSIEELKTAIEAAAAAPTGDETAGEVLQAKLSALALKVAELDRKAAAPATSPGPSAETAEKLETLASALQAMRGELKSAQDQNTAQQSKLETLQADIAAARDAEKLTAAQSELAKALAALRTASAEGKPFVGPLEALRTRYPDNEHLQVLATHATSGTETKTALIASLAKVRAGLSTSLVPQAETSTEGAEKPSSLFDTLQNRLSSIVKVRPAGSRDWSAVVEQMEAQAKKGNLAEAVSLADSIGEAPPDALAAWLTSARSRVAVDRALAALSATAMADLAGSRGTGG